MTERIPAEVFPPGEIIRDELEARNWTQGDLADIMGRPIQTINEIVAGKKAITPETARGLGDAFGTGAKFWLDLESTYRLSFAYTDKGVSSVARRARLFEIAPIKEMIRRQWIASHEDVDDLENAVVRFFEVKSVDDEPSLIAAARKSTDYSRTTSSQMAWLYRAKSLACSLDVVPYSRSKLLNGLGKLQALATSEEEVRGLPSVLGEMGIRLVVIERLPKTRIDGAVLWVNEKSPVIALSLRYDRIDGLWFTLGHELGHIVNRDGLTPIDLDLVGKHREESAGKPEIEQKADQFATELIVPPGELESFIARVRPLYSKVKINRFASHIGVHPGIVVGQLQYRGEIGYAHSREMLVKVRDILTETALTDGWGSSPNM